MKQIFTLATILALSTVKSFGQSQNFENPTVLSTAAASCWDFYGFGFSAAAPLNGVGNLYLVPTTSSASYPGSNANVGQITTPYLNLSTPSTMQFTYRLSSKLANNAYRYITVSLNDANGSAVISTITLDKNTPLTTQLSPIIALHASSAKKLVVDFTGDGDGNTGMFFDDMLISAPYAYSGVCAPSSTIILPVKLLSFRGLLNNNRAELNWAVDANETGKLFEVQKSNDGRNFSVAAVVMTTTQAGIENYTHRESMSATSFFRLKLVNNDGSSSYSNILKMGSDKATTGKAITVLQNPVAAALQFNFTAAIKSIATANIYSLNGAKVMSQNISVEAGQNSLSLDIQSKLTQGTYLLEVVSNNERSAVKIFKQ